MPSPGPHCPARSMSSLFGYFRFPKALTEKAWEDAMQEQDNEAFTSRRNTTNLKRIKRQIASVFTS